ncbi:hypothetical protein L284_11465 [Novosphingobium lindaniclasticum LE124]|uniref:Uncharacterized protein n=1 Tax=Novosphingobium lindaniclasticum LE124 TaxID=1096930 RepID=T0HFV9_9SPHN|nr:hypothetical protein L284_11465 [Novosphingobium lindaniclasticum LE124]
MSLDLHADSKENTRTAERINGSIAAIATIGVSKIIEAGEEERPNAAMRASITAESR